MTPERYQQIGVLFDAALECPASERSVWLEKASHGDTELRAEVEKLLANHVESEAFLARPAMEVAAELLVQNPPAPTDFTGRKISHYLILSLLGAGGMGQVYLARDTRLERQVALKLLPAQFLQNAEHLRRFEREALAASALNHPNILTIYEFGVEGEHHFLATEYVQGESLRQRLARGQLSVREALDITGQIAAALQTAHAAGIIHRDIKPDNVMIRTDGIVKVLDFGLAKLVEQAQPEAGRTLNRQQSTLTQQGAIVGTVAYMSPEQARGALVDARTDIFSLGVVLYEMLAGRQPFTGATVSHTIVAILEADPPPLTVTGQSPLANLPRLLNQMLAKSLEARYANAALLLAEVKELAKQLERVEEPLLAASGAAAHRNEAPTQIIHFKTHEDFDPIQLQEPLVKSSPLAFAEPSTETIIPHRKSIWWLSALLATGIVALSAAPWLMRHSVAPQTNATSTLPERTLSYFLTVQRYRNGKPYGAEFQSSGREIFAAGWQFKLNVNSPQEGFLYLLNEDPDKNFVLLFPLPMHNNGSAHLSANERFQTGAYLFDERPGTERFRLVWAAEPVPELEAVRELVNPVDKGRISDPSQRQVIERFLQQSTLSPIEDIRDPNNNQTMITGRGAVLVALIELEHR